MQIKKMLNNWLGNLLDKLALYPGGSCCTVHLTNNRHNSEPYTVLPASGVNPIPDKPLRQGIQGQMAYSSRSRPGKPMTTLLLFTAGGIFPPPRCDANQRIIGTDGLILREVNRGRGGQE
jgi:hypothetical protein